MKPRLREHDKARIKKQIVRENTLRLTEYITVQNDTGTYSGQFIAISLHLHGAYPVAKIVLYPSERGYSGDFREIKNETCYKGWKIEFSGEFGRSVKSAAEKF